MENSAGVRQRKKSEMQTNIPGTKPSRKGVQQVPRSWHGLVLPKGVFEKQRGSGVLWIRFGVGRGRLKRELAGKYIKGIRTAAKVLEDAIALLERRRTEVRVGKQFPERQPIKPPLTFAELAEDALRHSLRHKIRSYENDEQRMKVLQQLFRGRLAEEITANEIKQKLEAEEERRGWAPATFNNYRLLLSMTYRVAIDAEKVKSNPALGVKLRKLNNTVERWLSEDEEKKLRAALGSAYPERICEFNLLYYSGLRLSDVYGRHGKHYQSEGLNWSNVNFDLHLVTIPRDKNGIVKHVPLSPEAEAALRVLGERSGYKGRVMVDSEGSAIRTMGKWFWSTLRLAAIKSFRRHDLRHNLGSLLVQNGVPLQKVQKVLGHKDLKSTLRYAHLSNADGIQAASVLGRVRPSTTATGADSAHSTDTKTDTINPGSIHLVENTRVA
jgi:site-specific recombinase XerD